MLVFSSDVFVWVKNGRMDKRAGQMDGRWTLRYLSVLPLDANSGKHKAPQVCCCSCLLFSSCLPDDTVFRAVTVPQEISRQFDPFMFPEECYVLWNQVTSYCSTSSDGLLVSRTDTNSGVDLRWFVAYLSSVQSSWNVPQWTWLICDEYRGLITRTPCSCHCQGSSGILAVIERLTDKVVPRFCRSRMITASYSGWIHRRYIWW